MKRSIKTTLIGIGFGVIPIGHEILNAIAGGQHIDWMQVLYGIGFMALGSFAKDHNVTGGTN